jgi:hypothetical protein
LRDRERHAAEASHRGERDDGWIANRAIKTPFNNPATNPVSMASPTPSQIFSPRSTDNPNTTAQSAVIEPTDRSIPPVTTIIAIVSATNPNGQTSPASSTCTPGWTKRGSITPATTKKPTSKSASVASCQ